MAHGETASSSGNQNQFAGTLNPAALLFGSALGLPINVRNGALMYGAINPDRNGGLAFGKNGSGGGLHLTDTLFNKDTFAPLAELGKPVSAYNINIPDVANQYGNYAEDLFSNAIIPGARELAQTGFKTDIAPAVDLSRTLFQQEFLPAAAEQFGQLGLNPRDSDFGQAIAREASRRASELGALDVNLSEAAAGRRAAGLPLAAQLPTGLADSLFGLEQSSRQALRQQSPGGQVLDLLMTMAGIGTQGQGVGSGSTQSKSSGGGVLK